MTEHRFALGHFTSVLRRWKGASIIAVMCASMLSAPGVVAAQTLFGLETVSGGATPVAIDPVTGTVTPLIAVPTTFVGNTFDVASSGNTLYIESNTSPGVLFSVNETTGANQPHVLFNLPAGQSIADMTVANAEAAQVAEPTAAIVLVSSLAGLIGVGRRRRNDDGPAAPASSPANENQIRG